MTTRLLTASRRPPATAFVAPRLAPIHVPVLAGAISVLMGLVVLLGWALDVDVLKSMLPDVLAMKANTAICFVLLGSGLILLSGGSANRTGPRVGFVLVGTTVAIALATGAEYVSGIDLR